MKKKILIVNIAYPPEIRSIAQMAYELAQYLKNTGCEVTVLTAHPQNNLLAGEERGNRKKDYEKEDGIDVIRVRLPNFHKLSFLGRGLITLFLHRIFIKQLKKYSRCDFDTVLVYSPPLTMSKIGSYLKGKTNCYYVLNIQDIFPQNAIDLGALKNPFLIKLFEMIEKKAYSEADLITSHTSGSRQFLIDKKRLSSDRVRLLPNWVDIDRYRNVVSSSRFRKKFQLENKFVFLFAGIFGPSQGLELIAELANRLIDETQIHFLLLGEGMKRKCFELIVKDKGLRNVTLDDFVSDDAYPELVKEMDVGLACLSSKNKTPVIPGKIIGFMACARPVAAFLNQESDGHDLLQESGSGFSCRSDDPDNAEKIIRKMYRMKDDLRAMGAKGFSYAEKHYSKDVCLKNAKELIR